MSNSYRLPFVGIKKNRVLCYEDIAIGVSSVSLFHRNKNNIFFDEDFGMGAKFNSSEEFDYVLSLMQKGSKLFFSNEYQVLHPDSSGVKADGIFKRTSLNGIGHGAYIRKNYKFLSLFYMLKFILIRPFFGFIFYSLTLKKIKAKVSLLLLNSRLKGFFSYKPKN